MLSSTDCVIVEASDNLGVFSGKADELVLVSSLSGFCMHTSPPQSPCRLYSVLWMEGTLVRDFLSSWSVLFTRLVNRLPLAIVIGCRTARLPSGVRGVTRRMGLSGSIPDVAVWELDVSPAHHSNGRASSESAWKHRRPSRCVEGT